MKKAFTQIIPVTILLLCFSNCKKEDHGAAGELAEITSFSLQGINVTFDIDTATCNITHPGELPEGTDVSNLVADFLFTPGATVFVNNVEQASGVTANDFSRKVTYYVLSANKSLAKEYDVYVNVEGGPLSNEAFLTEFDIPSLGVDFTINQTFGTITHPGELPLGTDVTALVAEFSFSNGATVRVAGVDQESGVTVNDFTDPVVYSVTSSSQSNTMNYTVTLRVEPPPPSIWEKITGDAGFYKFQDQRAAMFNGNMYVMGTYSEAIGGPNFHGVWRSADGIQWNKVPTTPISLPAYAFCELLVLNNMLHLIGGATLPDFSTGNLQPVAQKSVFSSSNGTVWTEATGQIFPARVMFRGAVFNNEMFIIGGNPLSSGLPAGAAGDIWKSTTGTNWSFVSGSPGFPARSTPAVFIHDGKLWLTGGGGVRQPGPEPLFNDVWYTTNGSNWTQVSVTSPYPQRSGHSAISYKGDIYVLFGNDNTPDLASRTYYSDIWKSEDNGVTWTEVTGSLALPTEFSARGGASVLVDDQDKVWVIGGISNGGGMNDIWRGYF